MISDIASTIIRLLCGAMANWAGCSPEPAQRIYIANHTSHLDFLVIWSALPDDIRRLTRPVAAGDYWKKTRIRRFLAKTVFNAVLIDRDNVSFHDNPLRLMLDGMKGGYSLIIFPEGTRSPTGEMKPFMSGLFHLARRANDAEVVPVYLENLNRILPKGEILPVPLISSVTFGPPLEKIENEPKEQFLSRAQQAVEALKKQ